MIHLAGWLLIAVGAVFACHCVRPNSFCGFRLRWTLGDEFVWFAANAVMGELLMIWGAVLSTFGDEARTTDLYLFFVPLPLILFVVTIYSALLYKNRHGCLRVEHIPSERNHSPVAKNPSHELVLFAIPVAGWILTRRIRTLIPSLVPTRFDYLGFPVCFGPSRFLHHLHWLAFLLWGLSAVWIRQTRVCRENVFFSYFLLRLGSILLVESLVMAMVLAASHKGLSLWYFMAIPVGCIVGGFVLLLREAMGDTLE